MNRLVLLFAVLVIAACTDEGPVSAPGTLTVSLRGPNASEGAAVVSLLGDGIGAVTPVGDTEVHARVGEDGVRIVLLHRTGGTLAFGVAMADTTTRPAWVVEEVAGPDDQLRPSTEGYALDFSPLAIVR